MKPELRVTNEDLHDLLMPYLVLSLSETRLRLKENGAILSKASEEL